jgi:hypothetical protein
MMPFIDDRTYEPEMGSDFMKLQPGENKIRIASPTYHFYKHTFKDANGKFASSICGGENCLECQSGNKSKNRYAWIVIDRKDEKVKILEVGWSVYEQLLALAKDEEYGELQGYDIKIKKTGESLETSYQVVASPKKTAISEDEKANIEKTNIDLEKVFAGGPGKYNKKEEPESTITTEEVDEIMNKEEMPEDFLKKD